MPTVTVNQPATIKVRVEGQKSQVQSIIYGAKTLASLPDVNMSAAQTGDVLIYNANTKIFNVKTFDADAGFF